MNCICNRKMCICSVGDVGNMTVVMKPSDIKKRQEQIFQSLKNNFATKVQAVHLNKAIADARGMEFGVLFADQWDKFLMDLAAQAAMAIDEG